MILKSNYLQISCDGGASTGKSTGAKMISKKYNLKFMSSGLLYRYAGYLVLKFKPKNKIIFLKKKFNQLKYQKLEKINLHTQVISETSAKIAKMDKVRKILKKYQLSFVKKILIVVLKAEIFRQKSCLIQKLNSFCMQFAQGLHQEI